MDSSHPLTGWFRRPRRTRRGNRAVEWFRDRTTTTPGRLTLIAILVVAGAVACGAIAIAAERSRAAAAQAARSQTEPLLLQAATLYTALSDASATVTTTFLQGGLEPPARRAQYLSDLRVASNSLTQLTRGATGSGETRSEVARIAAELPVYSGLIEYARANNRQGFPVGAAYLRAASSLLTGTILADANRLYALEARRLSSDYASGTSTAAFVVLIVVAGLALALLILTQRTLTRWSRRVFNVPMVIGTLVLVAVLIWSVVGLTRQRTSLQSARRHSDAVEVLSASRVLLSRAQSDQSLTLVNRGSDEVDPLDFSVVMKALAPPAGLLTPAASAVAQQSGTDVSRALLTRFAGYTRETARITQLESEGRIADAITLASSRQAATIAAAPTKTLVLQTEAAQGRFMADAESATGALSGLSIAIPVLTVLAAVLAILGLRQRLEEYR